MAYAEMLEGTISLLHLWLSLWGYTHAACLARLLLPVPQQAFSLDYRSHPARPSKPSPAQREVCLTRVRCHVVVAGEWLGRINDQSFARQDFTENLENVILQRSLARFTLLLFKWMEYKIEEGFEWKMIYRE